MNNTLGFISWHDNVLYCSVYYIILFGFQEKKIEGRQEKSTKKNAQLYTGRQGIISYLTAKDT